MVLKLDSNWFEMLIKRGIRTLCPIKLAASIMSNDCKFIHGLKTLEEKVATREAKECYRRENLKFRESKVKDYQEEFDYPDAKSYFCRFHKRGLCIFTADQCKFAHTPNDFLFKKSLLDNLASSQINSNKKASHPDNESQSDLSTTKDGSTENELHQEETKEQANPSTSNENPIPEGKVRFQQLSLGLERTYRSLYNYQLELVSRGEMKETEILSQVDLDRHRPNRTNIRNKMLTDITRGFCDLVYKELGTNVVKRSLFERFFVNIGWTAHFPFIIDHQYAFEVKQKSGNLVVKLPKHEDFKELIEANMINVIKEFKLYENLPVSPSVLTKHYYKDHLASKPLEPSLFVFQKHMNLSLDQYLQDLQKSNHFIQKLAVALEKDPQELQEVALFETLSNEWKQFCERIDVLMQEYMKEAPMGLAYYNKFESKVFSECQEDIKRYNNNLGYIKRMIKCVALRHKVLVINLLSDIFLFSLDSFRKATTDDAKKITNEILHKNCRSTNPAMSIDFKHPEYKLYEPQEGDLIEPDIRCSPEVLANEINEAKVCVVKDRESLTAAIKSFEGAATVGVDLEGKLDKNGSVELVQCEYNDKIFVFDLYTLRIEANNVNAEDSKAVYSESLDFLRLVMESPAFCKIFHDGRKDSTGLHAAAQSCVVNSFDVSGIYSLINQLEAYYKHHKALNIEGLKKQPASTIANNEGLTDEKCIEILKAIEIASRPPGLNDVLGTYKASHGLNNLKSMMKERFWGLSRGYFLKRPIDKEFLIYSAKDVEDLAEVRVKMLSRLTDVLKKFYGSVPPEFVELFTCYLSHTYTVQGCKDVL